MTDLAARVVEIVRRRVWVATGLLVLPLIVALQAAARPRWYPAGDFAQAELHVRAVPAHLPLVGAAARVGTILDQGSHPGPAGAYVLALPYRLLGSRSWSLLAATAVLHIVAIAIAVAMARRAGGRRAGALALVVCALAVQGLGAAWFVEPWNPWFGVTVLFAALMALWALSSGDIAALPVVVALCWFCVQVHLGFGVLAAVIVVVAVALTVRAARHGTSVRRPAFIALGVTVLAWIPSLVDEFTREPGNLTRIWRHFSDPPEELAGLRSAATAFVNEFNLLGTWVWSRDRQPTDSPDALAWLGFLALVALVVAAAWSTRRSDGSRPDTEGRRALALAGIASFSGLVTLTRIFGPIYDYIVRWMASITMFTVVVAVWCIARSVRRVAVALPRAGAIVVAVALVAAAVGALDAEPPLALDGRITGALVTEALDDLPRNSTYLVRQLDPLSLGAITIGVVLEMERQGFSVGTDAWLSANVMPHRVVQEADADAIVFVAVGEPAIDAALAVPGAREMSRVDLRSADEVRLSASLRASIEARLDEIGRADLATRLDEQYGVSQVEAEPGLPEDLLTDIASYRALRSVAALVLLPVGATP